MTLEHEEMVRWETLGIDAMAEVPRIDVDDVDGAIGRSMKAWLQSRIQHSDSKEMPRFVPPRSRRHPAH